MLPFSSERYEQLRDFSLLIRLVTLRDLGPYTCQAYNGLGRADSWTITLQAVGPVAGVSEEDREYLNYLVGEPRPREPYGEGRGDEYGPEEDDRRLQPGGVPTRRPPLQPTTRRPFGVGSEYIGLFICCF